MRKPIQVEIVEAHMEQTKWDKLAAGSKLALSLIKDFGAISALILALISLFPSGKSLIIDIFSLSEPEVPSAAQVEAVAVGESNINGSRVDGDRSAIGWSYLGKADAPGSWYYPALNGVDRSDWSGKSIEPRTAIYLRSEPVSAVNPDPVALAVIGNDRSRAECLRVVGHRESRAGSIWLQGALIDCP